MELKLIFIIGLISVCNSERKVRQLFLENPGINGHSTPRGYYYRQDGNAPGRTIYLNPGQVYSHLQQNQLPYSSVTPHSDGSFLGTDIAKSYVVNHQFLNAPHINPRLNNNHYSLPIPVYKSQYQQIQEYNDEPNSYKHQSNYKQHASYSQGDELPEPIVYPKHSTHEAYHRADVGPVESVETFQPYYGHQGSVEVHQPYSHGEYASVGHDDDGDHHHHDTHYKKEHGAEYDEENHKKGGEKGSKGYKNIHEYSKGSKGEHDDEDHSNYYDSEGGKKASEHDEADYYHKHHKGEKGTKGGKFGEKKNHKKGSKTTGYHNVFHKDEYKKDHTFYDDADHHGDFHKYGSDHQFNDSEEGDYKKGEHHSAGHEHDHHGKKGHSDKGHHDKAEKGYDNKHGEDAYHHHDQYYAKKGGDDKGNHFGYESSNHH